MSSKWCCVLAVVCLLSLDADAQPTTDDITSCSASTLEEVVNIVKTTASNLQRNIEEIGDEMTGVKRQLADFGFSNAKSTTVNPIDYSTQSTPGMSCLVTGFRASPVSTATGFVNERGQFSTPHKIHPHPLTDHQKNCCW